MLFCLNASVEHQMGEKGVENLVHPPHTLWTMRLTAENCVVKLPSKLVKKG
jgi:hypothetical protein